MLWTENCPDSCEECLEVEFESGEKDTGQVFSNKDEKPSPNQAEKNRQSFKFHDGLTLKGFI